MRLAIALVCAFVAVVVCLTIEVSGASVSRTPSTSFSASLSASTSTRREIYKKINMTKYLNKIVTKGKLVGASLMVYKNNKKMKGFPFYAGLRNSGPKKQQIPVDGDTLFLAAGLSKPLVAFLLLERIADLQLEIDGDISTWLGLARPPIQLGNPLYPLSSITFEQLLNHTTSIRDNWSVLSSLYTNTTEDSSVSLEDWLIEYFTGPPLFSTTGKYYSPDNFFPEVPGTSHHHSNIGIGLMAALVKVLGNTFGNDFPEICDAILFNGVQATQSYWLFRQIADVSRLASPHTLTPDGKIQKLSNYGWTNYPDGSLRTCVTDYALVMNMFMKFGKAPDKFPSDVIHTLLQLQPGTPYYNYAGFYNVWDDIGIIGFHGRERGFQSFVGYDVDQQNFIVFFANSDNTNPEQFNLKKFIKTVWKNVIGKLPPPLTSTTIPSQSASKIKKKKSKTPSMSL